MATDVRRLLRCSATRGPTVQVSLTLIVRGRRARRSGEFRPPPDVCEVRGEDVRVRSVGWAERDQAWSIRVFDVSEVAQAKVVNEKAGLDARGDRGENRGGEMWGVEG